MRRLTLAALLITLGLLCTSASYAQVGSWSHKTYPGATSGSTVGWPLNVPSPNTYPTGAYTPYCNVPANQTSQQSLFFNAHDNMIEAWLPDSDSGGHEWGQSLFGYDPNKTEVHTPAQAGDTLCNGSSGGFFLLNDTMIHQNGGNGAVVGSAISSINWASTGGGNGTVTIVTTPSGLRSYCGGAAGVNGTPSSYTWCTGPSTISVGTANAPSWNGSTCVAGTDSSGVVDNASTGHPGAVDCVYNGQFVLTSVSGCTVAPNPNYLCSTFTYNTVTTAPLETNPGAQPVALKIIGPADTALTPVGRHSEGMAIDSGGNVWMGLGVGDNGGSATRIFTTHGGTADLYKATLGNPTGCTAGALCYVFSPICGIAAGTWCATPNAQVTTTSGPGVPCTLTACGYNFPLTGYDSKYNVLIFFGGASSSVTQCETLLYAINTGTWTNLESVSNGGPGVCPTGLTGASYPYARWAQSQSNIPADGNGHLIMFGYQNAVSLAATLNDTWVLTLTSATAGSWARVQTFGDNCNVPASQLASCPNQPPPSMNPLIDYVASLNEIILVDNQVPAHTWTFTPGGGGSTDWAHGTWADLATPANGMCIALFNSVCRDSTGIQSTGPNWSNFNATGIFDPAVTDATNCNVPGAHTTIAGCFVVFVRNATVGGPNAVQIWMLPVPAGNTTRASTGITTQAQEWTGSQFPPGAPSTLIRNANAPVTVGIPVPDAIASNDGVDCPSLGLPSIGPARLQLQDDSGTVLPSQFRCIAQWPSGKAKWILTDTQLPTFTEGASAGLDVADSNVNFTIVTGGGGNFSSTLSTLPFLAMLCTGSGTATANGVTVPGGVPNTFCTGSNNGAVLITTLGNPTNCGSSGTNCFLVKQANFNYIDRANINGTDLLATPGANDGVLLMGPTVGSTSCAVGACTTAYNSSADANSTCSIEDNGPMRAGLKCTYSLVNGSTKYLQGTLRLEFFAGRTDVQIRSDGLRNAQKPASSSTPCASADFNCAWKQYASYYIVRTWVGGTNRYNIGTTTGGGSTGATAIGSGNSVELYQAYSTVHQWTDLTNPNCLDTSVSVGCVSSPIARTGTANTSYMQNGWQINSGVLGAQATVASGTNAQKVVGFADVDNSTNGIEIGIRDLTGNWPNSLEFRNSGNEIRIGFWPDQQLGIATSTPGSNTYFTPESTVVSPITNIAIDGSNQLTVSTVNTVTAGDKVYLTGLTTALFLNGQVLTVTSATGSQIVATFNHAAYTSAADTGRVGRPGVQNYVCAYMTYCGKFEGWMNFHLGTQTSAVAAENFLEFEAPLIARAPFSWYNGACSAVVLTVCVLPTPIPDPLAEDQYLQGLPITCNGGQYGGTVGTAGQCMDDVVDGTTTGTQPFGMATFKYFQYTASGGGNQHAVCAAFLEDWAQRGGASVVGSQPGRYRFCKNFMDYVATASLPHSDFATAPAIGGGGGWRSLCSGTLSAPACPTGVLAVQGFPTANTIQGFQVSSFPASGTANIGEQNFTDLSMEHAHQWPLIHWYFITGDESYKDSLQQGAYDAFLNPNVGFNNGASTLPASTAGAMGVTRALGHKLSWIAWLCELTMDIGETAAGTVCAGTANTEATGPIQAGEETVMYAVANPLILSGYPAVAGTPITDNSGCPDVSSGGGFGAGNCSEGISPVRGAHWSGESDSFIGQVGMSAMTWNGGTATVTATCAPALQTTGANCGSQLIPLVPGQAITVGGATGSGPTSYNCSAPTLGHAVPNGCAIIDTVSPTTVTFHYANQGTNNTPSSSPAVKANQTLFINAELFPPGDCTAGVVCPINHATIKPFMEAALEEGLYDFSQAELYVRGFDWTGTTKNIRNGTDTAGKPITLSSKYVQQLVFAIGGWSMLEAFTPPVVGTFTNNGGLDYDLFPHYLNSSPPCVVGACAKYIIPATSGPSVGGQNTDASDTPLGDWGYAAAAVMGSTDCLTQQACAQSNGSWQPDYETMLITSNLGSNQERWNQQQFMTDSIVVGAPGSASTTYVGSGSNATNSYAITPTLATLQPVAGVTVSDGTHTGYCTQSTTCTVSWPIGISGPAPDGNPTPYWLTVNYNNSATVGIPIATWLKFYPNCTTTSLTQECTSGTGLVTLNPCNGGLDSPADPISGQITGCWTPAAIPTTSVNWFTTQPLPQPASGATSTTFSVPSGKTATVSLFAWQTQPGAPVTTPVNPATFMLTKQRGNP